MTDERERLISKLRAILAKTAENGCTEGEVMAALAAAQRLMSQHDITAEELAEAKAGAEIIDAMVYDPHGIRVRMSQAIAKFTETRIWRGPRTHVYKCHVRFCGLRADVEFAEWLLESLGRFVQRELTEYLIRAQPATRQRRNEHAAGFVAGATRRIGEKLNELAEASVAARVSAGRELAVAKHHAIAEAMAEAGIKLANGKNTGQRVDMDAMARGRSAGDAASFGRPIGESAGEVKGLLR